MFKLFFRGPYVLVYRALLAGAEDGFTLTASVIPFSVTAAKPSQVGNSGPATIEIDGARFDRNTTFQLIDSQGRAIDAEAVTVADSTKVFATFDLTAAAIGGYTVRATQSDGSTATLANGLSVVAGVGANLQTGLATPSITMVGRQNRFLVNYSNEGDGDIGAPLLTITSPTNTVMGLVSGALQDGAINVLGASPGGAAGVLKPGDAASPALSIRLGMRAAVWPT